MGQKMESCGPSNEGQPQIETTRKDDSANKKRERKNSCPESREIENSLDQNLGSEVQHNWDLAQNEQLKNLQN